MTNHELLMTAMRQSAVDLNCDAGDFLREENRIVYSVQREGYRKYLELPFACNLVSYGNNIVASISPEAEGGGKSLVRHISCGTLS